MCSAKKLGIIKLESISLVITNFNNLVLVVLLKVRTLFNVLTSIYSKESLAKTFLKPNLY